MQLLSLIACGVVSGLLSGMLGIGGGLVVVPALYLILRAQDVALPLIPQAAIATSLAAMIPTALASSWAQARRGALDPAWLRRLAPGVALGAALGAVLAGSVRGSLVSLVFVAYASFFAWRMLRAGNAPPRPQRIVFASGPSFATPPFALRLPVGAIACLIGLSSAVAGIGGAIVTVPYLVACSMDIKRAVAVSSAVSFVIALVAPRPMPCKRLVREWSAVPCTTTISSGPSTGQRRSSSVPPRCCARRAASPVRIGCRCCC